MIAKVSRGKSFSSTIRYVLGELKKPRIVFANFVEGFESNVDKIIEKFSSQAAFNHRVTKPVYHVSISPAANDSLSDANWAELTSDFIAELELNHHDAIAVIHQDTFFPNSNKLRKHLHIVVNTVGDNAKCANFLLRLLQNRKSSSAI
jgi:hypothetical protein